MGWSYSQAAGDVLRTFKSDKGCCSNEWKHRGRTYIFEVDREREDVLRGEVFEVDPRGTMYVRHDTFEIADDGAIVHMPLHMRARLTPGYRGGAF